MDHSKRCPSFSDLFDDMEVDLSSDMHSASDDPCREPEDINSIARNEMLPFQRDFFVQETVSERWTPPNAVNFSALLPHEENNQENIVSERNEPSGNTLTERSTDLSMVQVEEVSSLLEVNNDQEIVGQEGRTSETVEPASNQNDSLEEMPIQGNESIEENVNPREISCENISIERNLTLYRIPTVWNISPQNVENRSPSQPRIQETENSKSSIGGEEIPSLVKIEQNTARASSEDIETANNPIAQDTVEDKQEEDLHAADVVQKRRSRSAKKKKTSNESTNQVKRASSRIRKANSSVSKGKAPNRSASKGKAPKRSASKSKTPKKTSSRGRQGRSRGRGRGRGVASRGTRGGGAGRGRGKKAVQSGERNKGSRGRGRGRGKGESSRGKVSENKAANKRERSPSPDQMPKVIKLDACF